MKNICKNCKHWNNRQSELEYSSHYGICTSYKHSFSPTRDGDCCLLDRENPSGKYKRVNRFENQSNNVPIGDVDQSRYCLVTEEMFGCVNFEKHS